MRLDSNRCHHGDDVQKENYVAYKWIGSLMSHPDFQVGPHELRSQPHCQTKTEKPPEEPGLRGSLVHISKNDKSCARKNAVLKNVAKSSEGKSAWGHKGQQDVNADHCAHDGRPPAGVLTRSFPHNADCMIATTLVFITEVTTKQPTQVRTYISA